MEGVEAVVKELHWDAVCAVVVERAGREGLGGTGSALETCSENCSG